MKTSTKLNNTRRALFNEYQISENIQKYLIEIIQEIEELEKLANDKVVIIK